MSNFVRFIAVRLKQAAKAIVLDGQDGFKTATDWIGSEAARLLLDTFNENSEEILKDATFPHEPKIEICLLGLFANKLDSVEDKTVVAEATRLYSNHQS